MTIIDQRKHPRRDVLQAVMITPNGTSHEAVVLDMSLGGVRLRLPGDWVPRDGAALRVQFLADTSDPITLEGWVTRVAVDHMGVQFAPAQEARVRALLEAISRHESEPASAQTQGASPS